MKTIGLLLFFFALSGARYIEEEYKEGDRYIYFPDGDGNLHLVDLQETVDESLIRVEPNRLRYYLFTRSNPTQSQEIYLNDPSALAASNFDVNKYTEIIVHGWMSKASTSMNPQITAANLEEGDVNVIVFDWSAYASNLNYFGAARNAILTGHVLGEFVDFLISQGCRLDNIHLVGFSLGGHLVGAAGRSIKSGQLPLITSLDPAGPSFGSGNSDRLNADDAVLVEVIHTNADYLGNGDILGDIDFFVNGGKSQNGCLTGTCSHNRAPEYYAESVGKRAFLGNRCQTAKEATDSKCSGNDFVYYMGGAFNYKNWRGIFHVATNRRSPFALN